MAAHGGIATEHVSRQTTMLVIGEEGWPLEDNGYPSVKLQQAERWRDAGCQLQLLNESQWLALLGLNEHREEVRRLYTPAMLSSILGISVHVIRGWERAGLIRPVRKVYRLPYFDFREVSSARRLSELLAAGVSRKHLEESLRRLPSVQRGDERPLEQLQILAHQTGSGAPRRTWSVDAGLGTAAAGLRPVDPVAEAETGRTPARINSHSTHKRSTTNRETGWSKAAGCTTRIASRTPWRPFAWQPCRRLTVPTCIFNWESACTAWATRKGP